LNLLQGLDHYLQQSPDKFSPGEIPGPKQHVCIKDSAAISVFATISFHLRLALDLFFALSMSWICSTVRTEALQSRAFHIQYIGNRVPHAFLRESLGKTSQVGIISCAPLLVLTYKRGASRLRSVFVPSSRFARWMWSGEKRRATCN
jgi:hypothetical protein